MLAFTLEWDDEFAKLGITDKVRRIPPPIVYHKDLSKEQLLTAFSESKVRTILERLNSKFNLLILNHSRQYWRDHGYGEIDQKSNKGNDRLIYGFAEYVKMTNINPCLILMEYGIDVEESKALIKKLGIEANVFWVNMLPRKEIMLLIEHVDIVCSSFVNSYLCNGVIFETLAMGKVLMGYRDDSLYDLESYGVSSLYPMIKAHTSDEVLKGLIDFENNKDIYVRKGIECQQWYLSEVVEKGIGFYESYFNSLK